MKFYFILMIIALFLTVTSCGKKQPSEVQKARIDGEQVIKCLVMVNENLADESPNIFSGIALLSDAMQNLPNISSKDWELYDETSQRILLSFTLSETEYNCNFSLVNEVVLLKVSRNDEVVYDKAVNDKLIEERQRKEAEEEAAAAKIMAEEKAAAAKREAEALKNKIETWIEKGYSNVSYKYYEKHYRDSEAKYDDPTLVVVCDLDFARVKFDDSAIRFNGQHGVNFEFLLKDGEQINHKFDLTSNGSIGLVSQSQYTNRIYLNEQQNKIFINKLKNSKSITAGEYTFDINDFTQIPCI